MEFPANDDLIDFEKILSWLDQLYRKTNLNYSIQEVASSALSWTSTMIELPAFLEKNKKQPVN